MEFFGARSIPLYFIYGLSFFIMGVSALQQSNKKISNFPLMKALIFLAGFGLIHGISEWVSMIIIAENYPDHITNLYRFKMFLNSTSFACLLAFGIALFEFKEEKYKKLYIIPWGLLTIWLIGYFIMEYNYSHVPTSVRYPTYSTFMSRYLIGFPGGLVTAIALYKNGVAMRKLNMGKIAFKFQALGLVFLIYGILAGIVVASNDFFPANIVNKHTFEAIFRIPVEAGRTFSAIAITFLFIDIIKIFTWEISEKISRLVEQQVITQERRKMGRELHDVVIQKLFATGLKVALTDIDNKDELRKNLDDVNDKLNEVIEEVRNYIEHFNSAVIEVEDMKLSLSELIERFQNLKVVDINLNYQVPPIALGQLSSDKLSNIYYIVQECLSNIIKHSKASRANVLIKSTLKELIVVISDNGTGYDTSNIKSDSYGIRSIKERTALIEGNVNIKTNSNGTLVTLTVPWEEYSDVL